MNNGEKRMMERREMEDNKERVNKGIWNIQSRERERTGVITEPWPHAHTAVRKRTAY